MIVGIFFGTLAVIAGLFVASLFIATLVRGALGCGHTRASCI